MAKVTGIKSVFNAIESIFKEASEVKLQEIGEFARNRVVAETRKGKDLTKESDQPGLSPGYIEYRKGLVKRWGGKFKKGQRVTEHTPIPDPTFFRPAKSNVTLTGQLLESIQYKIRKSEKTVIIEPTGTRDDGLTNKEVAEDLAKRGRTFLGLDQRGVQRIRNIVIEAIRRIALKKGY